MSLNTFLFNDLSTFSDGMMQFFLVCYLKILPDSMLCSSLGVTVAIRDICTLLAGEQVFSVNITVELPKSMVLINV